MLVSPGPVAFTLFGLDIMWYGVLIGGAMLLAIAITYFRAPDYKVDADKLFYIMIFSVLIGVIGARLYYVAFRWEDYAGNLAAIFNIRGGGLAIHGGIIFGFGFAVIMCLLCKIKPVDVLDLAAPALALAQAIGRWGNFFNEEAHGIETNLPLFVFIDGKMYHPTFLYESIWCFLLFLVLMAFERAGRKFRGQIALLYVILYSFERFFVEWLRTDSLMIGQFRQAQVISVFAFVIAVILYAVLNNKANKSKLTDAA